MVWSEKPIEVVLSAAGVGFDRLVKVSLTSDEHLAIALTSHLLVCVGSPSLAFLLAACWGRDAATSRSSHKRTTNVARMDDVSRGSLPDSIHRSQTTCGE